MTVEAAVKERYAAGAACRQESRLWSGCISGAFQNDAFPEAFTDAGFADARHDDWQAEAWQEVQGLKFYSATVCAVKSGAESNASNCC